MANRLSLLRMQKECKRSSPRWWISATVELRYNKVASCIRYKHVLATCLQSLCYIRVCHKLKFDCASLTVMSGESCNKKKQQQKRHKTADEQLKGGKVWLTPSSTRPPLHVHTKVITRKKKVCKLLKGLITQHEATVQNCNAKHLNEIKLTTLKKKKKKLPLCLISTSLSREYAHHLLYWQHWEGKKKCVNARNVITACSQTYTLSTCTHAKRMFLICYISCIPVYITHTIFFFLS